VQEQASPKPGAHEVTLLIDRVGKGDSAASARLMELVYDELRRLAASYQRQHRPNQTLQPTALVHEVFVKIVQSPSAGFESRAHFFAVAATAMRQIITDYARAKKAAKRGGDGQWAQITLDQGVGFEPSADQIDLILLDEALTKLMALDERKHRIVELRFFGGLSVDEVAQVLNLSKTSIEKEWRAARAWLLTQMGHGQE
jgi:RNA polymerase sigma-70 factor (ECF subfamily)